MRKLISIALCLLLLLSALTPVFAEETEHKITTVEEFLTFAESCRLDSYSQGLTVSLQADIDLTGTAFAPIPIFCGTFLGNGHTISGLDITSNGSGQGLFRYLTRTAVVQDLHVRGTLMPQGSRETVGGIAGENAGVIQRCSFIGEVTGIARVGGIAGVNTVSGVIEGCHTEGTVHGSHFIGGIAGENAGVIRESENAAAVNTTVQQNSVDISDITMGTIIGTESVNTVTDIGGIAGSSSGVIRQSKNTGDVGYKHIGYNIGGIAGSQTGYITECENHGAVSGRKEIGGIVGHMEPAVLLRYETDTLQLLRAELEVLGDLTDRAVLNAEGNTAAIENLTDNLENYVANAEAALNILTLDPENPQIKDVDTYIAAVQNLSSSLAGIGNTLRSLNSAVKDTGEDLKNDLQAIADQMDVIDGILKTGEENLGGSVTDVSDADTAEDLTSKAEAVTNYGPVLGDLNVGGIVGAMAPENDLDPEEDVSVSGQTSLNAAGTLRSVVLSSVNRGAVTAKKQNAGGIVGWQSMGLVRACINAGALDGGDYTGGIVGQSQGYIRHSHANCVVVGDDRVGGIAGSGTIVTDCRSMVKISGTERVGAILGVAEENRTQQEQSIANNLYVSVEKDPGAVDGISYGGVAEPMTLEAFLALEGLPEIFKTVRVTFQFADGTSQVLTLAAGDGLSAEIIPAIPERPGFTGRWEGLENAPEGILFDIQFEVAYISHGVTVQSSENRGGKPILLIQGDFSPSSVITMSRQETGPALGKKEILLESWQFAISDSEHITKARYLIPEDGTVDRLQVYVQTGDVWQKAEHTVSGSYLVFDVPGQCDGVAITEDRSVQIPWVVIAAVLAAVAAVVITVVAVRKKKVKQAVQEETKGA